MQSIYVPYDEHKPFRMVEIPPRGEEGFTYVLLQDAHLVTLHTSRRLSHVLCSSKKVSRWQTPTMRAPLPERATPLPPDSASAWDPALPPLPRPPLHITNIIRRAYIWRSMLGKHLTADTRTILEGKA